VSSIPADEVSGTDVAGYTTPPEVGTSSADAMVASKSVSGEMARGITRASTMEPLYSSHLEPVDCESGTSAITGLPMNTAAVLREVACGEGADLSPQRSLVFRATAPRCSPEEDFDDWG